MKKHELNFPISKEILENGTIIYTNNITKKMCVFSAHHTLFFDGKNTFWVYGETSIFIASGEIIEPYKIKEFYKGNFSHSIYLLEDVVFVDKVGEKISDYKIIFKTKLPKTIYKTKEERIKNWLKDHQLSILFTKTKGEISKLINEDFEPYLSQAKAAESEPYQFTIFLN